jgi:catechol 2,3-dioxygenase
MGPVHLTVRDAAAVSRFYVDAVGLEPLTSPPDAVRLGAGGRELVVLHHEPDAPVPPRRSPGLYHLAILLPSREDLGRWLLHYHTAGGRLDGASDHLVSEALYLSDPEGNGIEVYRDRPADDWPREPNGSVRMASDPLDLESLIEAGNAAPWTGIPAATRMGHVHLRVSDIGAAEAFYVGLLGFEERARFRDAALFLAAGDYHHHVGLNTWTSAGAPPPPPGAAGLREFIVVLQDRAARDRIVERARAAGVAVDERADGVTLVDPSANHLVLAVAASGPLRR